jgi:hypothetical protein
MSDKGKGEADSELFQTLARGYCTRQNERKVLDDALIKAMVGALTRAGYVRKEQVREEIGFNPRACTRRDTRRMSNACVWREINQEAILSTPHEAVISRIMNESNIPDYVIKTIKERKRDCCPQSKAMCEESDYDCRVCFLNHILFNKNLKQKIIQENRDKLLQSKGLSIIIKV